MKACWILKPLNLKASCTSIITTIPETNLSTFHSLFIHPLCQPIPLHVQIALGTPQPTESYPWSPPHHLISMLLILCMVFTPHCSQLGVICHGLQHPRVGHLVLIVIIIWHPHNWNGSIKNSSDWEYRRPYPFSGKLGKNLIFFLLWTNFKLLLVLKSTK